MIVAAVTSLKEGLRKGIPNNFMVQPKESALEKSHRHCCKHRRARASAKRRGSRHITCSSHARRGVFQRGAEPAGSAWSGAVSGFAFAAVPRTRLHTMTPSPTTPASSTDHSSNGRHFASRCSASICRATAATSVQAPISARPKRGALSSSFGTNVDGRQGAAGASFEPASSRYGALALRCEDEAGQRRLDGEPGRRGVERRARARPARRARIASSRAPAAPATR